MGKIDSRGRGLASVQIRRVCKWCCCFWA